MKVILISTNAGLDMGGEAIKAYQYFKYLLDEGFDAYLLTHERNETSLKADFPDERVMFVRDSGLQRFLWKSVIFRRLLAPVFHLDVAKQCQRFDKSDTVLHYIGPVSPVEPRFPPQGYTVLMGPFTGNIYYPPAFAHRMSVDNRLAQALHKITQKLYGVIFGDKKQAARILVSGYERTRASLKWAGCRDEQLKDVVDSGISPEYVQMGRAEQTGTNTAFALSGRMVDHKGTDLAIQALTLTDPAITLTLYGDGPRRKVHEALAKSLGLSDRVNFAGWLEHEEVISGIHRHRGYLFPSMAEANGIVMQEAMMLGVPVVALRWGGPANLADDQSAIYVDPTTKEDTVRGLAAAMDKLAFDPEHAEMLSVNARNIAEARFPWEKVAKSYSDNYAEILK